jgi:TDG/mug DNA glycosylase family protein
MERPTKAELEAAEANAIELPDLVRPGLRLLLVGINPGRYSGASGFHFGNPRNHLWYALHRSGLTPRQLRPDEPAALLALGIGITNLVMRTTRSSSNLTAADYRAGVDVLRRKVAQLRPAVVAVLGKGPYEAGFDRRSIELGRQPERLEGAELWVLPNPSPINAWYPKDDLVRRFGELRAAVENAGAAPRGDD